MVERVGDAGVVATEQTLKNEAAVKANGCAPQMVQNFTFPRPKPCDFEAKRYDPELVQFAHAESKILSEILDLRLNHLDALSLFIEVMKLSIRSRENERETRSLERIEQIKLLKKEVAALEKIAKDLRQTGVTAGIVGILGGAMPIIGALGGAKLQGMIPIRRLRDMGDKMWESVSKMMQQGSETSRGIGQMHQAVGTMDSTRAQRHGDMARSDAENATRTMDELLSQWREMEQFLTRLLQMQNEAANAVNR